MNQTCESSTAETNGIVLIIGITVILAVIILLLALQFATLTFISQVPDDLQISDIQYTLSSDGIHYIAHVVIINTGNVNLRNRYINIKTYINGKLQDCRIPTLNNHLFCSSDHTGVSHLQGVGTWGNMNSPLAVWPAHSVISIEYKKGMMRPGDKVMLEFFDTNTGQLISRDSWPHTNDEMKKWMNLVF